MATLAYWILVAALDLAGAIVYVFFARLSWLALGRFADEDDVNRFFMSLFWPFFVPILIASRGVVALVKAIIALADRAFYAINVRLTSK